jgi:hypothetical protein
VGARLNNLWVGFDESQARWIWIFEQRNLLA